MACTWAIPPPEPTALTMTDPHCSRGSATELTLQHTHETRPIEEARGSEAFCASFSHHALNIVTARWFCTFENSSYINMHWWLHIDIGARSLYGRNASCVLLLSQRNNHICFNDSTNLSCTQFSPWLPGGLPKAPCSSSRRPHDQLCVAAATLPARGLERL